tara:strand:+ start:454 stop:1059 length:606 start_codon:yes stop_codon:yes gene_type:complete
METEPILSFCIRSLHPDIREQDIRSSLDNVFNISKIDFVNKNTRPIYSNCRNCFKMAFIHVESWNKLFSTVLRENVLCDIRSDDGLKIYYKDFKYFVLRENLNPIFKRERIIESLKKENSELYKVVSKLTNELENIRKTQENTKKIEYADLHANVPLKKRLKKKKNQKNKQLDKDIEDYLYITTDEEDNNIHMNVSLIDEV